MHKGLIPVLFAISGCHLATTDVSLDDAALASPDGATTVSPGDAEGPANDADSSDGGTGSDDSTDAASVGPQDAARDGEAGGVCITAGTELCDDFESGHIDP